MRTNRWPGRAGARPSHHPTRHTHTRRSRRWLYRFAAQCTRRVTSCRWTSDPVRRLSAAARERKSFVATHALAARPDDDARPTRATDSLRARRKMSAIMRARTRASRLQLRTDVRGDGRCDDVVSALLRQQSASSFAADARARARVLDVARSTSLLNLNRMRAASDLEAALLCAVRRVGARRPRDARSRTRTCIVTNRPCGVVTTAVDAAAAGEVSDAPPPPTCEATSARSWRSLSPSSCANAQRRAHTAAADTPE